MPRARRTWSSMRAELRGLLRETVAGASYWPDADLLAYFNQAIDLRSMMLADQHEGWITDDLTTDIVANQGEYVLPEGIGRLKRVVMVFNEGSATYEIPLSRNERWSQSVYIAPSATAGSVNSVPTMRLLGNILKLDPPPVEARTGGLKIEHESSPARLVNDTDKLSLFFPSEMETLLIYDAWDIAVGVEDATGTLEIDSRVRGRLKLFHMKYEAAFMEFTSVRTRSRTFSEPFYLGD